ncbi:MAG TPA: DUF4339 domain-containing protein [Verrucomicrobiae bacterium]|nr:DUF4339 domain-containing protein [Verrucomicrobiae bacterium]
MSEVATPIRVVATSQWWVQVRGKAYGPYTMAQLSDFVTEGRVRPATKVSDAADGPWIEARRVVGLMAQPRHDAANENAEGANVFVHVEIFSGSWDGFMAALTSMGHICELAPGLWIVRTRFSAGVVRNTLSQTLERGDRFVVIDATRDRLAWFNLGPETDVKINKVWNGPLPARAPTLAANPS